MMLKAAQSATLLRRLRRSTRRRLKRFGR
jgi:hypothetical protein